MRIKARVCTVQGQMEDSPLEINALGCSFSEAALLQLLCPCGCVCMETQVDNTVVMLYIQNMS